LVDSGRTVRPESPKTRTSAALVRLERRNVRPERRARWIRGGWRTPNPAWRRFRRSPSASRGGSSRRPPWARPFRPPRNGSFAAIPGRCPGL